MDEAMSKVGPDAYVEYCNWQSYHDTCVEDNEKVCEMFLMVNGQEFFEPCDEMEEAVFAYLAEEGLWVGEEPDYDFDQDDEDDEEADLDEYFNECIVHTEHDCLDEAQMVVGADFHIEECIAHNGWDECEQVEIYDECYVRADGRDYNGPCDTIEQTIREDSEQPEGCPRVEAGDCLPYLRDLGVGEWIQECWYQQEVEVCSGESNYCFAAVRTHKDKWIDGECEEVHAHVEEVQARKDKKADRKNKKADRKERRAADADADADADITP